ncbi:MAG: hypothetical protein NZ108_04595, partial [Bacteroidia bacterium]|nr:hypothetical protein [Bacteroidia bacterium]
MRKSLLINLVSLIVYFNTTYSQVGIGVASPHTSSILELQSTTKGLLIPRLTQLQILSLLFPAKGLLVYNTTLNEFQYYDGLLWQPLIPIGIGDNWGTQSALTTNVLMGNGLPGNEIRLKAP